MLETTNLFSIFEEVQWCNKLQLLAKIDDLKAKIDFIHFEVDFIDYFKYLLEYFSDHF